MLDPLAPALDAPPAGDDAPALPALAPLDPGEELLHAVPKSHAAAATPNKQSFNRIDRLPCPAA